MHFHPFHLFSQSGKPDGARLAQGVRARGQIPARVALTVLLGFACYHLGRWTAVPAPQEEQAEVSRAVSIVPAELPSEVSLTRALRAPGLLARTTGVTEMISRINQVSGFEEAAMELHPTIEETETSDAMFLLAEAWADLDPVSAARFFADMQVPGWRSPFLFAAISRWAEADSPAARAWLDEAFPMIGDSGEETDEAGITRVEQREYYQAAMIRGVSLTQPQRAAAMWMEMPQGPSRSSALEFVVTAMGAGDGSRVREWISQMPEEDPESRRNVIRLAVGRMMLEGDKDTAIIWASGFNTPDERGMAIIEVAANHARVVPKEAAVWASGLDGAGLRGAAVAEAVEQWARQEPENARAWLDSLPPSPEWDMAERKLAWTILKRDPAAAFDRVARIERESLRYETSETLGRMWITTNPLEAADFIRRSPLFNTTGRRSLLDLLE
jgi:hypothetical protein